MNLMNDRKDNRFKSYIDDGSFEIDLTVVQEHRRKLLDGEQLIHQSQNVILFDQLPNSKPGTGLSGLLTVTTFKLSFTPSSGIDTEVEDYYQKSSLLGPYEVCLSAIDTIYHIVNSSRKKLVPCQNVSSKIKELQVVCKNMRVLWFSFKNTEKDSGRQVTNTLLHHVYPKRHSLLFAYDFPAASEKHFSKPHNGATSKSVMKRMRMFRTIEDWQDELKRTGCENWRITMVNESFDPCPHLPRYLIVPKSVTDSHLLQSLRHFRNECFPVWMWGTRDAALVRMADLLPTITDRTQENTLLEKVRESHPSRRAPEILYLDRLCPTAPYLRHSYLRLRDLCTPSASWREAQAQDARFYGLLDATRWLHHVSKCLEVAAMAARALCPPSEGERVAASTVVLQEGNGQDMNCLISSLIQILLDPYARTNTGFQTLIQKEWVAMGHPFASRLGHVLDADCEPAPLLLLFLDCVWQLLQQFPVAFQYSETYLTTVWDSAHLSAYETFLFNTEHTRVLAERDKNVTFKSVWDWSEQFSQKDINLFCNPLYNDSMVDKLSPQTGLPYLEIWTQCYFRWMPNLEIRGGGRPHADICMRYVANEINSLRNRIGGRKASELNGSSSARTQEDMLDFLSRVNSFFPFSIASHRHTPALDEMDNGSIIDNLDTQSQSSS